MAGLVAQRPGLCAVRRVITQAATLGGEDFEAVTDAEFVARVVVGAFVLHWQAHGLRYGITVAVRDDLDQGHDVLANLSRGVLSLAQQRLERVVVLNLTARPDTLVTRLGLRGREVGGGSGRTAGPACAGLACWVADDQFGQ